LIVIFINDGRVTLDDWVNYCLFSSLNDKVDHRKMLKSEGYCVKVVSDEKGPVYLVCSSSVERVMSLKVEGFDSFMYVYIGAYDPDVPFQIGNTEVPTSSGLGRYILYNSTFLTQYYL
jgi:hypothetical protein